MPCFPKATISTIAPFDQKTPYTLSDTLIKRDLYSANKNVSGGPALKPATLADVSIIHISHTTIRPRGVSPFLHIDTPAGKPRPPPNSTCQRLSLRIHLRRRMSCRRSGRGRNARNRRSRESSPPEAEKRRKQRRRGGERRQRGDTEMFSRQCVFVFVRVRI